MVPARRRFAPVHAERFLFPLGLLFLNFWLIQELFRLEYGTHLESIECAYMAISRFLIDQWPDISWFRFWYGGVPFTDTYPPLLNIIVAGWALLARMSVPLAYHQVIGAVYCLAPVTLYWFAVRLGADRRAAALAGLLYSVLSPAAFLIKDVRLDLGSVWFPRRFDILLPYGEGPHQMALMLLPISLIALDRLIERWTAVRAVAASVAIAAVLATNWLGTSAFAFSVICLLLARSANRARIAAVFGAVAFAYLLDCVLLPPQTVLLIQRNSRFLNGGFSAWRTFLPAAVLASALLFALRRASLKFRIPVAAQFFLYASLLFAVMVLGQYWLQIMVVPQAHRYQLEMDYSVIFGVTLGSYLLVARARRAVQIGVLIILFIGSVRCLQITRAWCRGAVVPIDITQTMEYRFAQWLNAHIDSSRVYLSGSPSFWLNVWSNAPQAEGDFNNGIQNWNFRQADSAVIYAPPGEAILWLKSLGARYFEIVGRESQNAFHYMPDPSKFDGLLPVAVREGQDVIYRIDGPAGAPAHLVAGGDLVKATPRNISDVEPLRWFVHQIESNGKPLPSLLWTSNHSFDVQANLARGDHVSVAESWCPGWRAQLNGTPVRVFPDGLGLIAAAPNASGPSTIHFEFAPSELPLFVSLAASSIAAGVLGRGFALRRRKTV